MRDNLIDEDLFRSSVGGLIERVKTSLSTAPPARFAFP
jgi:hypothetical protein